MHLDKAYKIASICLATLLTGLRMSAVGAAVTSTFDTGLDGWTHAPGGDAGSTVSYSAAGGNPGGAASLTDAATGANDFFLAPAKFLGNDSVDLNGIFSFQVNDNSTVDDLSAVLTITDAAGDKLTHALTTFATGVYVSFSFTLNQNGGFTYTPSGGAGSAATLANFQTVLGNVSSILIPGDFHNGTETVLLDNVLLVPEPSTLALTALGLVITIGWFGAERVGHKNSRSRPHPPNASATSSFCSRSWTVFAPTAGLALALRPA